MSEKKGSASAAAFGVAKPWTLTERNEVVGYDVAGEQPEEKYRFPTVSQPNTVAVDPRTGRVVVASGTGDGIQVIAL